MVKLTFEKVVESAEKIVGSVGTDFRYIQSLDDKCIYGENGQPSCIVGHILFDLDKECFDYIQEDENDEDLNSGSIKWLARHGVVDTNNTTLEFLAILQELQDAGVTWKNALKKAKEGIAVA